MNLKEFTLIERYLATSQNRIRLVQEKVQQEVLVTQSGKPHCNGLTASEQGESQLEIIDLQLRALSDQIDSCLKTLSVLDHLRRNQ